MDLELIFLSFLILSTLFCSLVSGFVFAFAVVVMPGIKKLKDSEFIRAFQVMDRVIQDNQPLFIIVWVGSAFTLLISAVLGIWQLEGIDRILLLVTTIIYIVGVQLPTIGINIPLNNKIQLIDTNSSTEAAHQKARNEFEQRWNFWNSIRTVLSCIVSLVLIIILYSL